MWKINILNIFGLIFVILGGLGSYVMVSTYTNYQNLKKSGVETKATITGEPIYPAINPQGTDYFSTCGGARVFANFTDINGISQKTIITQCNLNFRQEESVSIYYDPKQPTNAVVKLGNPEMVLYGLVVEGIFIIGGAFLILAREKSSISVTDTVSITKDL